MINSMISTIPNTFVQQALGYFAAINHFDLNVTWIIA